MGLIVNIAPYRIDVEIYIHIYIHTHICTHTYICIYITIYIVLSGFKGIVCVTIKDRDHGIFIFVSPPNTELYEFLLNSR